MSLCEIKDDRLINAKENGFLELFCYGIISNIWSIRGRVKTYKTGKTSPLYEMCNHVSEIKNDICMDTAEPLTITEWDYMPTEFIDAVIEKYKEGEDVSNRFRSRVFYYSEFKYKSILVFSKRSGIPYETCRKAYNKFKEIIKHEFLNSRDF